MAPRGDLASLGVSLALIAFPLLLGGLPSESPPTSGLTLEIMKIRSDAGGGIIQY